MITGFGFAAASCNDHPLAETFFVVRRTLTPRLSSVGAPAQGVYGADKGFAGEQVHRLWHEQFAAQVVSPPHKRSKVRWSKEWRRWLGCAKSLRPPTTSCSIPSGWLGSVRMRWAAFKRAWPPKWPCITFASGSTGNSDVSLWLSLICSTAAAAFHVAANRY